MKHRFDILVMAVVGFAAVFAVLAAGSAAAAGKKKPRPKAHAAIIGGAVAPAGAWPSTVYIQALTDPVAQTGFACTGTVVAPDVVLTAGHCAVDETSGLTVPAAEYTVVTGTQDLDAASAGTAGQVLAVSQVIPDPAFRTSTSAPPVNDAALLILSTPTTAPSIPLASTGDAGLEAAGTAASIAGWGLTRAGTNITQTPPAQLQQATTAVVSDRTCDDAYNLGGAQYVSGAMLCTQDPARLAGTCNGDSGGPLLARRADGTLVEVGLTSWGVDGCSPRFPSVFTRVSELSAWVSQEITLNPSVATAPPSGDGGSGTPATTGETPPPSATDTTPQPPPPASTPPPLAPTPLPPPPVASPVVKALAAGLFRGTTGQRRSIALRVAGAGAAAKKLSELRFGYRLTCRRPAAHASATLAPVSSAHRWAIAVGHGKLGTFDRRVRSGADVLRVTGTFTSTKHAQGTLRVSRHAGGCDTGVVHWSASLR